MGQIRGKNTKPELLVRSLLHRLGYRYRIHYKALPGVPDLAFPARRKVIFVHGCFWHRHDCPVGRKLPRSNTDYWLPKLSRNKERDMAHQAELNALAWRSLIVWECEIRNLDALLPKIMEFLGPPKPR